MNDILEMMSNEEAVKILKQMLKPSIYSAGRGNGKSITDAKRHIALCKAIEALSTDDIKKQITRE